MCAIFCTIIAVRPVLRPPEEYPRHRASRSSLYEPAQLRHPNVEDSWLGRQATRPLVPLARCKRTHLGTILYHMFSERRGTQQSSSLTG